MRALLLLMLAYCPVFVLAQEGRPADTVVIYFGFGKYDADAAMVDSLCGILKVKGQAADSVWMVGQTDTVGADTYNLGLASRRCRNVDSMLRVRCGDWRIRSRLMAIGESWSRGMNVLGGVALGGRSMGRRGVRDKVTAVQTTRDRMAMDRKVSVIIYRAAKDKTDKAVVYDSVRDADTTNVQGVDTVISLGNVFFRPDSPIMSPESRQTLANYQYVIDKYAHHHIEIRGHVHHTGLLLRPGDPLFQLSEERAKVIYDYFIEHGFDKDLISYRGVGNSMPLYPNTEDTEKRKMNMRVEVIVFKR